MAAPQIIETSIIPSSEDFEKLLTAKLSYEAAQKTPDKDTWNKKHFNSTPWGIAFNVSKAKYDKSVAAAKSKGWNNHNGYKQPQPKNDLALKYFIVAVALDWQELVIQLKRTLKNWEYTSRDLQYIAKTVWLDPLNAQTIADACDRVTVTSLLEQVKACATVDVELTEAVEKHETLNNKLFTKEELLKDKVRDKMLEIVDEFVTDLKEQDIKIKIEDIILIGSNASYNYTKDSDIDLHILADTKGVKYTTEVANALYSAYRSLFNKQLDIKLFDIPLELFVETEDSPRVSNGVYSVKKNKWVKKPVHEDIPDYDKEALDKLVNIWEIKCKALIDDIEADKLKDEKKVVKLLADIYNKLRKKGIAKGEYSIENLTFKELRNKGYLDKFKTYRNELVSKRLSLEERLGAQTRANIYNQIAQAAGTQPIIQDNGIFFIYNIKNSEISSKIRSLQKLPIVDEVFAQESGKYDFSDYTRVAMGQIPPKYYSIRGKLVDNIIN